jgi:UDP-N-acetylglucosamine 2-epimerase
MGNPIVHVVGARPQFVKAAAVLRPVSEPDRHVLVHTGQHYDPALSDVFFQELGIPPPAHHLEVGSGSHGAQTAAMLARIEEVLLASPRGLMVVYGDTNSTVAAALAAAKLHWPIAHVEAGLRSFDKRMPEEVNRVLTDHISDILLCPTASAVRWAADEGLVDSDARSVVQCGDVMLDIFQQQSRRARETACGRFLAGGSGPAPTPLDALPAGAARHEGYILATVHRPSNTDDRDILAGLLDTLSKVGLPVLWPVHPRTRHAMDRFGLTPPDGVHCVEPVGYLDFVALLHGAAKVLTDSGGVQKEAIFAGRHCTTLRETTEWVETLRDDWSVLTGPEPDAVLAAVMRPHPETPPPIDAFGDGHAAEAIARILETH